MVAIPYINGDPETLDLSYGTDMAQTYLVSRVSFGDQFSQRKTKGLNSKPQQWRLIWNGIKDADAEMLRKFFEGLAGVSIIDWKPYGQAASLKWTANNWSARPNGFLKQDCSITLTQEFDL